MIELRLECVEIKSEELAKYLNKLDVYKIWMYENKTYTMCKVKSLPELNSFAKRLTAQKILFTFSKIEKLPWWKLL